MESESAVRPLLAFRDFFAAIPEFRRAWLASVAAFRLTGEFPMLDSGDKADAWLQSFLVKPERPEQQFGRLICLIAVLDFELSPFALARVAAEADQMSRDEDEVVAAHGRQTLEHAIPELRQLVDQWKDLRKHELDEASLWVYRDEREHQRRAELIRRSGLPR
jgi:hypothetical protein